MNIKNKKIIAVISILLILLPMVSIAASFTFNYEPMEKIPGFGRPTDFPSYIMAIYKFGLWAVGICALLMISIGGYMYLTSAGNTSQTGKAKEIIIDSIVGIVLAFTSWILLYTINPDLVVLSPAVPDDHNISNDNSNSSNNTNTQLYKCICTDDGLFWNSTLVEENKSSEKECIDFCLKNPEAERYSFSLTDDKSASKSLPGR